MKSSIKTAAKGTDISFTAGIFYQRSNDAKDVVYTIGFTHNDIMFIDANGQNGLVEKETLCSKWIPRKEVKDFPSSKNPRLPYVYDLFWDLKNVDDIKQLNPEEKNEVIQKLKEDYPDLQWEKAKQIPWGELRTHIANLNDKDSGFIPNDTVVEPAP